MQLTKHLALLTAILLLAFSCEKREEQLMDSAATSFKTLTSDVTGINFSNNIIENDTLNYFTFPYMYMGGGVAIGDINNDDLPDIYFTGNMVSNKLYLNKGNMRFEDISEMANVSGDNRWYTGATMADVNNDGWLDIYVSVSGIFGETKNQLFINNKDNTFSEKAEMFGLQDDTASIQATFFDYNNDGLLDIFVANYPIVPVSMGNQFYYGKMQENKLKDSGHLYKNNGDNTFSDVTAEAKVQNFGLTLGVIASDFNNDGLQDLYLSNDFNVPDYFYLNNGDGTFREVLKASTNQTAMFGMGIDVADFNNDKLLDLFQLDMTPEDYKRSKTNMASMSPETFYEAIDLGMHYQYMQNVFQVNNGVNENGLPIFSNISRLTGMATTDWSWGTLFADFDNDGLKDIIITNGMKRDVNNNDVNKRTKVQNFSDLNKEIDYRQYPSNPLDNYVYRNEGDYKFSKVNESWGITYKGFSNGVSYADLDNDGDLDVVINNLGDVASVFENKTSDNTQKKYLMVKLNGPETNPFGLGTRVSLKTEEGEQLQELTLTRGFQSSVEPILYFGLNDATIVQELTVEWPNGNVQNLVDLSSNQTLTLHFANSEAASGQIAQNTKLFEDITVESQIDFMHKEDNFDDFLREPLLPHKNSAYGPALTVGDVNNDGLEDFFVGNASGSTGKMYVQNDAGAFDVLRGPWEADYEHEDTGALLFDADNDGDLDLYVVNGGNDPSVTKNFYQDRLYINTGEGFIKATNALPKIVSSGSVVLSADYDNDGDQDLFIGGRIVPGKYPFPAQSYLLRNDGGVDGALKFSDVTDSIAPELKEAGLVTAALWEDFNADGKMDLIVTGEWMPIRFFKNMGSQFEEITEKLHLNDYTGWWYGLQKADVDGDGDTDYLVGNLGLNYKYKAKPDKPFEVYANDFDENGTMDIVLTYKKNGKQLPLRGRECSSQQVPAIAARFQTFELFADATLADIYGQAMLDKSLHYKANMFENSWIENKGNENYELHKLPNEFQFTSWNAFEQIDLGEKQTAFMLGGNLYNAEVETPRNDAGVGGILTFDKNGAPQLLSAENTGLFVRGEIRNLRAIRLGKSNTTGVLVARNDDKLILLKLKDY